MLIAAAALTLLLGPQDSGELTKVWYLNNPGNVGKPRIMLQRQMDPLVPAKVSPMHKWEFPFIVTGFGPEGPADPNLHLRLRVYHQRNRENEPAPFVARAIMRLWDHNYLKLKLDHSPQYNNRIVDIYLCWGGNPGGAQRFDVDRQGDRERKVNTIYIYQLDSFTEPVEMIRELAHEYGHATLPPVGGFKTPEDWANGYLGEKLYLKYLRDELVAGRLLPEDAMMATADQLDKWVADNVDPLILEAAKKGPDKRLLRLTGSAAMNHYLGLTLFAHEILPAEVFTRSMVTIGSIKAADYPAALVRAVRERKAVSLTIPPQLRGLSIWLPAGVGKLKGSSVIKKKGDWALVKTSLPTLTLTNP